MKRLLSAIALQIVLQYRHGFYAATLVIFVPTVILLNYVQESVLAWLLPPVLLQIACVNGVFFAAGLFYYEGTERTALAQAVTPLGTGTGVLAKALTLSALTVIEGVAITLGTYSGELNLFALVTALGIAPAMLTFVGIALAARHASVSEFIIPAIFYSLVLLWPLLHYLGVGADWTVLVHPLQGAMDLFAIATAQETPEFTPAILLTPFWAGIAYLWATSQSQRWIRREA